MGRFAWVFYYVFSLYTAYALYAWYLHLTRRFVVILCVDISVESVGLGSGGSSYLGRHASA
ncbi:MAG: hypothetical protein IPL35_09300, partial [Sphingobacteriales bacterium]|nr:hypothetical protein [Sphingobacteriales bacterium]